MSGKKKLSLDKSTLRNLQVRTDVKTGVLRPSIYGSCVPSEITCNGCVYTALCGPKQ